MLRIGLPFRSFSVIASNQAVVAVRSNYYSAFSSSRAFSSNNASNDSNQDRTTATTSFAAPKDSEIKATNLASSKRHLDLATVNKTIEEITGVHEIAALKQAVSDASDQLQAATQQLQDLRSRLDQETAHYQELSAKYNEMMTRRHEWSPADVKIFAQLTADEGKARNSVEATRQALKEAEEHWQLSQTIYMDSVRQRYHEEQVWHDKWRVLGTYWTWTLIGLNSVVFVAGQILHYRRETRRMNTLAEMIHPLTVAAQLENEEKQREAEQKSKENKDQNPRNGETDSTRDETSSEVDHHHRIWKDSFQQWKQSSLRLFQYTGKLLQAQWTSSVTTCSAVTQRFVWQPSLQMANDASVWVTNLDKDKNFHWPSALLGASVAGVTFVILSLVRTTKQ